MVENAGSQTEVEKTESDAPLPLKVEVRDVGPSKKAVKVEIPAEAVKAEYEKYLTELERNAEAPGFRKGHVPRVRLLKMFGKELIRGVKTKLVSRATEEAIKGQKLEPVSEPILGPEQPGESVEDDYNYLENLELKLESPFSFEFSVEVKPSFELPQYKGLKLKTYYSPVTDEQVEEAINKMPARLKQVDYLAVEDGKVKIGDRLTLAGWKLEADGKVVAESGRVTCLLLRDGLEGLPVPVSPERLEGASANSELTLDVTIPDDFSEQTLRGKTGRLTLKVEEVKRPHYPPLDDAAAKELGAPDVASLRSQVKERLEVMGKANERMRWERDIVDMLLSGVSFEIPTSLARQEALSSEFEQISQLLELGVKPEAIPRELLEKIRERAKETSPQVVRAKLILEKIAEVENIDATDSEVEERIYHYALLSGKTPVAVRSRLERSGGIEQLRQAIRRAKVLNFIIQHADIESASPGLSAEAGRKGDA